MLGVPASVSSEILLGFEGVDFVENYEDGVEALEAFLRAVAAMGYDALREDYLVTRWVVSV